MVAPGCRLVLDGRVLARVVVDIGLDALLPRADAGLGRRAVHQGILGIDEFLEIGNIFCLEIIEFEYPGNQSVVVVAPMERILASGIVLHAAVQACAQRVVVVERDEEEPVVVQARAVEVDVVVVGVVPVVVPHAHGNIDGIGLEQQVHVGHLLNPSVKLAV